MHLKAADSLSNVYKEESFWVCAVMRVCGFLDMFVRDSFSGGELTTLPSRKCHTIVLGMLAEGLLKSTSKYKSIYILGCVK